jgi:hypothetical protein
MSPQDGHILCDLRSRPRSGSRSEFPPGFANALRSNASPLRKRLPSLRKAGFMVSTPHTFS